MRDFWYKNCVDCSQNSGNVIIKYMVKLESVPKGLKLATLVKANGKMKTPNNCRIE